MEKALQASTVNLELTDWFLLLEASQGKVIP
jgi:predicted oxidoreductase